MGEVSAIVAVKYMDIRVFGGPWEPAWLDSPRPLPLPLPLAAFTALFPCGRRRIPEEPPASDVGNSISCEALPSLD